MSEEISMERRQGKCSERICRENVRGDNWKAMEWI
jgi:hypothetical protein